MVPYVSLGQDEVSGIVNLLRISNAKALGILEQAAFIDELKNTRHLSLADIAEQLSRSKSWVSMRVGLIAQMSVTVPDGRSGEGWTTLERPARDDRIWTAVAGATIPVGQRRNVPLACSSSVTSSRALAIRSVGQRVMQRRITASSSGAMDGFNSLGDGGGLLSVYRKISSSVPWNG